MVPTIPEYTFDCWIRGPRDQVVLTCLMPNGITIPLEASRNATLLEIKEDLWEEANKYPLHGMLHDMSVYMFTCVNSMAEMEQLVDETRRIGDVRPFCCILRITECKGDTPDRTLNTQISHVIGKSLHEFEALKDREVNDFRLQMRILGGQIARERLTKSWIEKLYYQFPPRITIDEIPQNILQKLGDGNIILSVKFEKTETTFTFHVPHSMTPHKLLISILHKKANTLNQRGELPSGYVLKVCGQEEYLVGDYPLIRFLYIQDCLMRDKNPVVVTTAVENVPITADNLYENPEDFDLKQRPSCSTLTLRKKNKQVFSWKIEEPFVCEVQAISGLNCDTNRNIEVRVKAGLFHGGKALCETQSTCDKMVSRDGSADFNEQFVFDINVCNIPRMARLCFVVYEISKIAKGVKSRRFKESNKDLYINPLVWVNTTIYDYKSQLKTGPMTLYMWTYAEDIQGDDLLHPLGTVVSNPNREHSAALTLSFDNYGQEQCIIYPRPEKLISYAQQQNANRSSNNNVDLRLPYEQVKRFISENIDPLHELHDQERKTLWSHRKYCLEHVPQLLPRLLHCVEWNDRYEICEMTRLIEKWPLLRAEKALELLDYAYADQAVRSFAVKCLSDVTDEELSLYLLQLVQALKHESFLWCDLVIFLLKRALNNQKIGHFLFWHLRSEMQVPSVSVRFGLILEAYCLGSPDHIPILLRQMECLDKLKASSEFVRSKPNKEKARLVLQDCLTENMCDKTVNTVLNPLNPSYRCGRIKIDKCKVMDSKMRPLWIVFENADPYGDDIYIIMKNGDDLRQDMLTLQMLRIMDKLWKNENLDLRMIPYSCISTEHRVGMIEVVLNAETIANIQKEKGMFSATSAFRRGSLLAWLKDHNTTETALNKAIDEFTLSCAGYCVATYVLGVADRHSDNIMVKKTGQLFHIDFGHILGHFKEKFGFRRERVPFVLTHDFVYVINKGKREALEFQIFQKHCEQAFMILRKHGALILSLFAMMISTGLPELSSEKDLNYLRETLVLDLSEQEALTHFRSKFDEALCNSWKTSLNWASHNLAKNNKQ